MTTEQEKERGRNIRIGLNGILKLWASKNEQLDFQKNVPIADVSAELFCQWSDDFYDEENPVLLKEFNQMELQALKEFDNVICHVADIIPEELPPINEFIKTHEWEIVHLQALSTLKQLQW
jgi:hypothetical protein